MEPVATISDVNAAGVMFSKLKYRKSMKLTGFPQICES